MNLVRVDELAQEIGISPDELFSQLKSMGFDVVNVTSSVERDLVEMVSDMLTPLLSRSGATMYTSYHWDKYLLKDWMPSAK